ncbi:MAG TPA: nuclear transport factor 2 family protein [Coleofasciculaceae cyanobacterium]
MHNPATLLARLSRSVTTQVKSRSLHWSTFILLTLGLAAGWTQNVRAASPETAPPQLKETLAQIDAAANRRDIQSVMQFYNANFKNSDGLTRASMEQALAKLWEQYPQLTYRTELKDWQTQGNNIVAETVTYITGNQEAKGTVIKLESTMRSRQRFDNQTIVGQEILSERTQLTSGANPPDVQVILPEQVRIGQQFNFDVIVKEPLGDDLLLGTALEEPIKPELYTKPTNFELELLPAGGIFKQGKAPLKPENHWVSAVLVRGDGMTMITQRLQVVAQPTSTR